MVEIKVVRVIEVKGLRMYGTIQDKLIRINIVNM
jgi:hypothetical protein